MAFRVLALVFGMSLFAFASTSAEGPAGAKPVATRHTELPWARGVAEDFLAAWIKGSTAQAELLVTEEMKKRYAKYPQGPALASELLDLSYTGLSSGGITEEQLAPEQDEARFIGKLRGTRNGRPIDADFTLRVVREAGKWRVSFYSQQWRWADTGLAPTR
jgi:hypothetical protein